MKKTTFLIAALVFLIVSVAIAFFLLQQPPQSALTEDQERADQLIAGEIQPVGENGAEMKTASGRYRVFTPEVLSSSADTRRVLFFYANWCPTCKPADASFSENADKIPTDVTVIRVNYNDTETDETEKALAQQYGVTYQHTFVQVDATGKEVTKWNGGQMDQLLTNIQ